MHEAQTRKFKFALGMCQMTARLPTAQVQYIIVTQSTNIPAPSHPLWHNHTLLLTLSLSFWVFSIQKGRGVQY